jgi:hypothetical protein
MYRRFAGPGDHDFSDAAAMEMYVFETTGQGPLRSGLFSGDRPNGYAVGKKWMDATAAMWREDIRAGLLWRFELESDYPGWFLDRVLAGARQGWPLGP